MYSTKLENKTLYINLYKDIENINELRQQLESGSFECCLIKAALVPSPFVLAIAANKSITSEKYKTRTLFSEILFNLSISKNITASLQQFGATEADQYVLALTFDQMNFSNIIGKVVDVSALKNVYDSSAIQKAYKLTDHEVNDCLVDSVCNKIAIKDIV